MPAKKASAPSLNDDEDALWALRSKIDAVEKSRAELQAKLWGQMAELVELRVKVAELDERRDVASAPFDAGKEEVLVLHAELERLS